MAFIAQSSRIITFLVLAIGVLGSGHASNAQPSTGSISFQAKLDGVTAPTVDLTFQFWDAAVDGLAIGPPILRSAVAVTGGVVSTAVPVAAATFNGQDRWLSVSVNGGGPLSPRTLVTSVPYAISAQTISSGYVEGALRVGDKFMAGPEYAPPNDYAFTGNRARGTTYLQFDPDYTQCAFYPLLSNGNQYCGFGMAEGPHRVSPIVWMYANTGNTFEVRVVGFGTQANTAPSFFTVHSSGQVNVGNPNNQVAFGVYGPSFLGGNVLVGGPADHKDLLVYGNTRTSILTITGADMAEPFDVARSDAIPVPGPGMVVSIDPKNPGKLTVSNTPYDKKVAGAISGAGGLSVGVVMGKDNADPLIKGEYPVAMSGRVYVLCDAAFGPIHAGDRLTTSATPGHAMAATDSAKCPGAVIGKAMSELKEGTGLVLVLVNLQ